MPCRNRVSGTIYGPFRCSVFFSFAFIVVAFLAVPCTWARLSHGVFAGVLARFPPSRAAGAAARARSACRSASRGSPAIATVAGGTPPSSMAARATRSADHRPSPRASQAPPAPLVRRSCRATCAATWSRRSAGPTAHASSCSSRRSTRTSLSSRGGSRAPSSSSSTWARQAWVACSQRVSATRSNPRRRRLRTARLFTSVSP